MYSQFRQTKIYLLVNVVEERLQAKNYAADKVYFNMTAFADCWNGLPEELFSATVAWQSFWVASGVPKHTKPNIALIEVLFIPPATTSFIIN